MQKICEARKQLLFAQVSMKVKSKMLLPLDQYPKDPIAQACIIGPEQGATVSAKLYKA